jgi:hypothetical protein
MGGDQKSFGGGGYTAGVGGARAGAGGAGAGGAGAGGALFEALKTEVERGQSEAGSEYYSQRGSTGVETPRSGSFAGPMGAARPLAY